MLSMTHDSHTVAALVSDILGGANQLGLQGTLEIIGFSVVTGMMGGAFALAAVVLARVL